MTANPLKSHAAQSERIIAPSDPEEKVRFWIDHGNMLLVQHGKPHLHWVHFDGHYYIEERVESHRRAMMANPNYARAA